MHSVLLGKCVKSYVLWLFYLFSEFYWCEDRSWCVSGRYRTTLILNTCLSPNRQDVTKNWILRIFIHHQHW